ncbi:MAG TPA: ABC transporter substrate-binding protein [Acidimicrobiales bacterium]|nr:ABC transporter substrate-binding protein [Acidimicrobiales bacterium]
MTLRVPLSTDDHGTLIHTRCHNEHLTEYRDRSRKARYILTKGTEYRNGGCYSTYATNPLWQVVDGPWHLTSFNVSGQLTMKPNPKYSGPVKPTLSAFVELPFTSSTAEFNQLIGGKITVGYIPAEDITAPAKNPLIPGPNNSRVAGKFNLVPWYGWLINYFPLNFNSTDDSGEAGAVFRQLYFRQAMQMLINQPGLIKQIAKGYGVPVYGPVPIIPKNSFSTAFEAKDPYPYNPAKSKALLSSHGWKIVPNGTDTCTNASKCGVPAGTKLSFNLMYASGSTQTAQYAAAETSAWSTAGIHVTASAETFNTIIGTATPCTGTSCKWDMGWWEGWVYSPDYWPSGEDLFETGAASNAGSYSNPSMNTLIRQTNFGNTSLATFENYAALQLPDIWEPGGTYQISEIAKNLHGASPQNPLLTIQPEDWYFTK